MPKSDENPTPETGLKPAHEALRKKQNATLTTSQIKFAEAILTGLPLNQAWKLAFKAKFSYQKANDLLYSAKVAEYIANRRAETAARNNITQDEIIANLRTAHDEAMKSGQFAAAIRAMELLGKYLNMFDKQVKPTVVINTSEAPDRLEKIAGLIKPSPAQTPASLSNLHPPSHKKETSH